MSPHDLDSEFFSRDHRQESEANFVILMMPLINENQYKCIFKQTVIPQIIACRLWDALGYMRATHHLRCVGLLHQLHNIVPRYDNSGQYIFKETNQN